jgi:hypothetical protein
MPKYPILVERYDSKHPADTAVCEDCNAEHTYDPMDGDPYDLCLKCSCGGQIVFKYLWADRCPGCERLGWYRKEMNGCCSRRCMLVAEYAAHLSAR